jgi:hypothetical protein
MIHQERFQGESNYGTFFHWALVDRSGQRTVLLAAKTGREVSLFIAGICFYATLNQKVNRPSKGGSHFFCRRCMLYDVLSGPKLFTHSHDGSKVLYPGKGLVVLTGSMWNGVGVFIVTQLYQVTTFLGERFVLILFLCCAFVTLYVTLYVTLAIP